MRKKASLFLVSSFLFLVSCFYLPSAFAIDCPSGYQPDPKGTPTCYRQPPPPCNSTENDTQLDLGHTQPDKVCTVNPTLPKVSPIPLPTSDLENAGKFTSAQGLPAQFVGVLLGLILPIIGFIAVIMIVISGIQFVTSRGDPKAAEGARSRLTYAIIGFVITILAFAITQIIDKLFLRSGLT